MPAADATPPLRWGVLLPTFDVFGHGRFPVTAAARLAEELGYDSVWAGDHLVAKVPIIDAVCALAAAGAVTERVEIGLGILQLALRHPAWAAKQLATLDALAPGRVRLGVGAGGEYEEEFTAAGVEHRTRGRRLDEMLGVLPALLAGEAVDHPGPLAPVQVPGLLPPTSTRIPLAVGGRSDAALRRAARYGDQWMGMWRDAKAVAEATGRLRELAAEEGRPAPTVTMLVLVNVDDDIDAARDDAAELMARQYHLPFRVVDRWTGYGPPDRVATLLASYRDVGVDEFVLMPASSDVLRQYERLVGVRKLVDERVPE